MLLTLLSLFSLFVNVHQNGLDLDKAGGLVQPIRLGGNFDTPSKWDQLSLALLNLRLKTWSVCGALLRSQRVKFRQRRAVVTADSHCPFILFLNHVTLLCCSLVFQAQV